MSSRIPCSPRRERGPRSSLVGRAALVLLLGAAASTPLARAERKAAGAERKASLAPPTLHVALERYTLPSGLTVILAEDHRTPQVAANLWFRVGSKDERVGQSGFAHLFEHLMFMGTRRIPNGQFDAIMEAAGGQNNATTSEDRTNYFESGPSSLLETFLWLEADRLATLADDMTKDKLDLQREVVKNERRQSYENRPYGQVELLLPEHLYPATHPYHHPVIGSHQDLGAASVSDVNDFFHAYYTPSNATLVVAGDIRPAEARALVDHYFGWMAKVPVPTHAAAPIGPLARDDRVVLEDHVELPRVVLGFHSPAALSDGDAAGDVVATVLGGGKSSRLFRALVYERKLAQSVEVEQRGAQLGGQFVITVTGQPGHPAGELETALAEVIASTRKTPITDAELTRARTFVETQALRAAERLPAMADLLNLFYAYTGDPKNVETRLLGRYEAVDLAAANGFVKRVLGAHHVAVVVVPHSVENAPVVAPPSGGAR